MRKSLSKSKRNLFEAKLKRLSEASDKPEIEDFSSDSDEEWKEVKDFNVTLPSASKSLQRANSRPTTSSKSVLKFRKSTDTASKSEEKSLLGKRELFKANKTSKPKFKWKDFHDYEKPQTSKAQLATSTIENFDSSDDEELNSSPPEKLSKPTIENFEDVASKESVVIIPCSNTTEEDIAAQISQVSSEQNSQLHRFNVTNIHNVKVKPTGFVEKLLSALSEAQQKNIQWDCNTKTPDSQTQYFTVSHFEKVLGSVMIFFMLNDQKCAIFLEPTHKMVPKLKIGNMFAFCPDHEPYELEDGVKVYVGLTKLKFVH